MNKPHLQAGAGLALSTLERVARARADLRIGAPVAVRDSEGGAIALAAETASPARARALGALGPVDLTVTARRAETLRARAYDGDLARIALDDPGDFARIEAAANPALALEAPLAGPFFTRRDGPAAAHRLALKLCKQARLLPAALVVPVAEPEAVAQAHGLTLIDAADVAAAEEASTRLAPVSVARVPLATSETAKVHVFRPEDGAEEHYAIEIGAPSRHAPVLARLHSACFTGDIAGSLKCDCGPQLRAALAQIGDEGAGVLLYLNQEGRGIGLANKLRAYALQDAGFDTVEANHRLGFEDDERDFRIGAAILARLGFGAVRLMTNNPGKTAAMAACGLTVTERAPLKVGQNPMNAAYLATKAAKSGHLL
jgi:GTP cyclohydrolase II